MKSAIKFIEDDKIVNIVDIPDGMIKDDMTPGVYRPVETITGFYLERIQESFENVNLFGEESRRRQEKTIKRFSQLERSMGVMFSGMKGTGKSQTVKNISNHFIEEGYPCIVIDKNISYSILTTLTSKLDKCVFLFDEFEKNFKEKQGNENGDTMTQSDLLTFFDGIYSNGKFLFLLTANSEDDILDMFFDRPERIRFIFRYGKLSEEEIKEYLEAYDEYSDVNLSTLSRITLNFDLLKNIVQELKFNEDIDDITRDLGILKVFDLHIMECTMEENDIVTEVPITSVCIIREFDDSYIDAYVSVDTSILPVQYIDDEFDVKYLTDTEVEISGEVSFYKDGVNHAVNVKYTGFLLEQKKFK